MVASSRGPGEIDIGFGPDDREHDYRVMTSVAGVELEEGAVVESMKMEIPVIAPCDGTVAEVHV